MAASSNKREDEFGGSPENRWRLPEMVIRAVAEAKPQAVVHVGCDPATFARDLSLWHSAGYKPEKMALINAFPGTHHFEVIALITPDKEANKSAQDAV